MAETAKEAIESVEGYDTAEPRGVIERYTAWAGGRHDEGMAFAAAGAQWQCADRIAYTLFDLRVMEFGACNFVVKARNAKEWGYKVAADFANTRKGRAVFTGYRLDWSRQAARDGLCLALWGHLRGTGLAARAEQFSIGERPFQRMRDHVRDRASTLSLEYETVLSAAIALDVASYR
jgi:hypothetical protein